MPDYNLLGLNTRSFEQLIQTIAASVIGPGSVTFGDGPDGGRESVFEGKTQYPSSTDPWDGYVVVQAKFRQRPLGVEKDGVWALRELGKELKKFSGKSRQLRRPDYYIFCTNVVLTAVDKTGAKDRAHQLLGDCSKKSGMKGFAVWDYDQIRTYLDSLAEVRQTYAAWITPGDVLAAVIQSLKWSRPDFERVMANFLQKELLADQYVNLEQAGHTAEERTPMARVFTDLVTSQQPMADPPHEVSQRGRLAPGFIHSLLSAGADRLTSASLAAPYDGQEAKTLGRVVLVGGPGQGKTTIGQFACQLYRASILGSRPTIALSPEARIALEEITNHCSKGGTSSPACRRFPIRIVLNQFAKDLSSQNLDARSLIAYIAKRIKNRTDMEVTVEDLRQWLRTYPWFLVLDGLDEVPPSSNREEVLATIKEFWVDAAECEADILVLATTRPQGYDQDFSPQFYTHRYLAPLSNERALQYGRWLAAARYGNDKDREQRIVARLERASGDEATVRLMRSPLQVTIMATLVDQTGQPPRERWRLFHEYYEVIYKREMERDIPAAAILREHKSNIDGIHSQVGLILQTESEAAGQTDARLTSAAFSRVVEMRLRSEGYEGRDLDRLVRKIIDAATHRLVFLVGMEAERVGFEIGSLREFMAAEALTDGDDGVVSQRLNATAPVAHWRNVFLFAAGKCFAVRQHLRDSVLGICAGLNEDADDEVRRRTFLGSQLALDLLIDGAAHQQPKFERILARVAFKIADRPNAWLPNGLGDAYQATTDEVFREEVESRLQGTSGRPGTWPILLSLIERRVGWGADLGDLYWPSEVARQVEILSGWLGPEFYGREVKSTWIKEKLIELVFQIPIGLAFDSGFMWAELPRPVPSWYKAFSQRSPISQTARFRFLECDLLVHRVTMSMGRLWSSLDGGLLERPGWRPLSHVKEFAMSPDAAHLGDALTRLAENWDEKTSLALADFSPWPLAVCLRSGRSALDMRNLAQRATQGELGDQTDWIKAEQRWARGIRPEDVKESDRHEDLPGPHLRESGFCFGGARFAGMRSRSGAQGKVLFELYGEIRTPSLKRALGELLDNALAIASQEPSEGSSLKWVNLATLSEAFAGRGGSFYIDMLLSVLTETSAVPELVALLDNIGRNRTIWAGQRTLSSALYESICRAWTERPHLEGLLPVLALCTSGGENCGFMVEALESHSYSEDRFHAAALVLRVAHGKPGSQECDIIASKLVDLLADERFDGVRAAYSLASMSKTDPTVAAGFLLALYRHLAPGDAERRNFAMAGLDDILRRRASLFGRPEVQRALKLEFLSAADE